MRSATAFPLAALPLNHASPVPLHRQLCDRLREAILSGQLPSGTRLPGTRTLATELGVSRNTVVNAFEQLLAEGYVAGKIGAGTYIACTLPEALLHVSSTLSQPNQPGSSGRRLSQRGQQIASTNLTAFCTRGRPHAFQSIPAVDAFPLAVWTRLTTQRWRKPPTELLSYGDPAGYWPLREAIASYLKSARGVHCEAHQVIIVAGSQQGLNLAAHLLLDPGDVAWLEDPGYHGARCSFLAAGARVVPVPVDTEGLDVSAGIQRHPNARLVYVSPSHQFPTGVVMSLERRLALLNWADRAQAWILEDDYDSEFRYIGRPLSALQGLDQAGRVIYIGTFSKILLPTLRLGYLVVPHDLVDACIAARALTDWNSPSLDQAVLTDFIVEGHFAHHIRRMRTLYAERQSILLEMASQDLKGLLDLRPAETGMSLVGWLPQGIDDQAVAQQASRQGIYVRPLSAESIEPLGRSGLLLGFAAVDTTAIRTGVRSLAMVIQQEIDSRCRV